MCPNEAFNFHRRPGSRVPPVESTTPCFQKIDEEHCRHPDNHRQRLHELTLASDLSAPLKAPASPTPARFGCREFTRNLRQEVAAVSRTAHSLQAPRQGAEFRHDRRPYGWRRHQPMACLQSWLVVIQAVEANRHFVHSHSIGIPSGPVLGQPARQVNELLNARLGMRARWQSARASV